MRNFAQKSKNKFVVADFVYPLPEQLKIFKLILLFGWIQLKKEDLKV